MTDQMSYTIRQAAAKTGVSYDTILAAINSTDPRRKLKAVPMGMVSEGERAGRVTKYVIRHVDLEAWLELLGKSA